MISGLPCGFQRVERGAISILPARIKPIYHRNQKRPWCDSLKIKRSTEGWGAKEWKLFVLNIFDGKKSEFLEIGFLDDRIIS